MEGDKRSNSLLEFSVLLLIITFAVICAWNLDFSSSRSERKANNDNAAGYKLPHNAEGKNRWDEGKALFKSNCSACHHPKVDGTGPALMGTRERWKAAGDYQGKSGEQWMILWIKNWRTTVDSKYPYAINMANSRPGEMNAFTNLKDEDIEKILMYLDSLDYYQPKMQMSSMP